MRAMLAALLVLGCDGGIMAGQGERWEPDAVQYAGRKEEAAARRVAQPIPSAAGSVIVGGAVGDQMSAVGLVHRDAGSGVLTATATPAITNVRTSAGFVFYDVTLPPVPQGYTNVKAIPTVTANIPRTAASSGGISGGKQLMSVGFYDPAGSLLDAATLGFDVFIHVDFLFW